MEQGSNSNQNKGRSYIVVIIIFTAYVQHQELKESAWLLHLPQGLRWHYLLAPLTGNKDGSKELMVFRVRSITTRFPIRIFYTPLDVLCKACDVRGDSSYRFTRNKIFSDLENSSLNPTCQHLLKSGPGSALATSLIFSHWQYLLLQMRITKSFRSNQYLT